MTKRRPLKEIRADIRQAIEKDRKFLVNTTDMKENPQVKEMRLRAEGRIEAFRAALDALEGDNVLLNISKR